MNNSLKHEWHRNNVWVERIYDADGKFVCDFGSTNIRDDWEELQRAVIEVPGLIRAVGGIIFLGKNVNNYDTHEFKGLFQAAVEDALEAYNNATGDNFKL